MTAVPAAAPALSNTGVAVLLAYEGIRSPKPSEGLPGIKCLPTTVLGLVRVVPSGYASATKAYLDLGTAAAILVAAGLSVRVGIDATLLVHRKGPRP